MSELLVAPYPEAQDESHPFRLYTGVEFFESLQSDIAATDPGDRVAITTMSFEPTEPLVRGVLDELDLAAERKVDVTLGVDAYTFLTDSTTNTFGPLWLPLPGQRTFKRRQEALDHLDRHPSAMYGIINKPDRLLSNPFAGRSHMKLAVVNNKIYVGGPNFHGSDRVDVAIGWEDLETADWVYELATGITKAQTTKVLGTEDFTYTAKDGSQLIVDVGTPNQSAILEKALQVIDQAQEWIAYSGQFYPHGETMARLQEAAMHNVDLQVAYNHPSSQGSLKGLWQRVILGRERRRFGSEGFPEPLPKGAQSTHAAVLATETTVLKGGHNFIDTGVKMGTPEINLLVHNATFANATRQLLMSQVALLSAEARTAQEAGQRTTGILYSPYSDIAEL